MSKKIYVGNLPYNTTQEDLEGLFSQYGEVLSARIIVDRETGRSKGFGFVEMIDEGHCMQAISQLNGFDFHGRPLNVSEAKPQESNGGGGSRSFHGNHRGSRHS